MATARSTPAAGGCGALHSLRRGRLRRLQVDFRRPASVSPRRPAFNGPRSRYGLGMSSETTIGHYRVLRRIAVGGMAEVFLAREEGKRGLEREVVVKRMLPRLAADDDFREMFTREASTMARLHHPAVTQVYELGEEGGLPFMAMEYVPGHTLRDVMVSAAKQERPIPLGVALDFATQACAGAHAAHELKDDSGAPLGIVHRDLTPHNLMVTPEGFIKLLDFGIVKHAGEGATATGVLKGKLAYLSPEQIEQSEVDRRADVFALAAVTWELLTGTKLYDGPNEFAILQNILRGRPRPLSELRPDLPSELSELLTSALASRREDRPASADLLRRELLRTSGAVVQRDATVAFLTSLTVQEAKEPTESTVRPIPTFTTAAAAGRPPLSGVQLVGAVGLLIATLAAMAGWWWVQGPPPPSGPELVIVLAPVRDPEVLRADLAPVVAEVQRRLDRPVVLRVGDDYADAVDAVASGEAPVGIAPPGVFLHATEEHPELRAIAAKEVDGSRGTEGVILAREGEQVPLDGPLSVCFADPSSTTGYHLARAWLDSEGVAMSQVDAVLSGNHQQVLRDLLDGRCALAATYTGNWTSAGQAGIPVARTRIVATTGWTPHDVVLIGPSTSPELATALADALFAYHSDNRGDGTEHLTGFSPVDREALEALRERLLRSELL